MAANGQCRSAPAVCVGYSAQGFAGLPIPFFGIVTHRFAEVRGVFQIIFQCQKPVFAHGTRHRELAFNVTSNYFDDFRLGQKRTPLLFRCATEPLDTLLGRYKFLFSQSAESCKGLPASHLLQGPIQRNRGSKR